MPGQAGPAQSMEAVQNSAKTLGADRPGVLIRLTGARRLPDPVQPSGPAPALGRPEIVQQAEQFPLPVPARFIPFQESQEQLPFRDPPGRQPEGRFRVQGLVNGALQHFVEASEPEQDAETVAAGRRVQKRQVPVDEGFLLDSELRPELDQSPRPLQVVKRAGDLLGQRAVEELQVGGPSPDQRRHLAKPVLPSRAVAAEPHGDSQLAGRSRLQVQRRDHAHAPDGRRQPVHGKPTGSDGQGFVRGVDTGQFHDFQGGKRFRETHDKHLSWK